MSNTSFFSNICICMCFTFILFSSCNPIVLDDFFGIQMDPEYIDRFEIVSYSTQEGAKYKSNAFMNPAVYAYAEIATNTIHIKIMNLDSKPLKSNFNLDEFYLHTENEKIALSKGDRENYPDKQDIKINESIQFNLELPTNFAEFTSLKDPQSHTANYTIAFWKGENLLNIIKEKIKYIEVQLGIDSVIMLKPISHKNN